MGVVSVNIIAVLIQVIHFNYHVMYISRLVVGIVSTLYTFLTPVTFKEYVLGPKSSVLMSTFYIGIATGTLLPFFFFNGQKFQSYDKSKPSTNKEIIPYLLIPLYLEILRSLILMFFYSESPRFRCMQIIKSNPELLKNFEGINDSTMSSDPMNIGRQNGLGELNEDIENDMQDTLGDSNIESVESMLNRSGEHMERLMMGSKVERRLKQDPLIKNYFKKFYDSSLVENGFNFFYIEFKNVISTKLLKYKTFFSIYTMPYSKEYRLQFFVISLLNFLNQMTGINCLIFYGAKIFHTMNNGNSFWLVCWIGKTLLNITLRNLQRYWLSNGNANS
jgi:hypothetical protein